MSATPGPEEFEAFERRMRARRNFFKVVAAAAGCIPVVLAIVSLTTRAMSCRDSATPPSGLEVDIDSSGRASVRGCADDLETCVRAAAEREENRPGGGRHRALIHTDLG